MSTVSSTSSTSSTSTSTSSSSSTTSSLDASDFYTLLVAEIKNQDPTDPVDGTDMVLQLTQLSAAESTLELNDTMTTYASNASLSTAAYLIGATVTYTDSSSNTCSGVVSSVEKNDDTYDLVLTDGSTVALDDVRTVSVGTTTSTDSSSSSSN